MRSSCAAALIDLIWRVGRELSGRQAAAGAWSALVAALVAFSPQMFVWQTIYGTPLSIPQGEDFMRWGTPALRAVLFSYWHGLFLWTPVVAIAVAGLAFLWRRDRLVFSAAIAFFALSWYVNAAAADWWAGEAFGSRRFVSCFAVFSLGPRRRDRTMFAEPEAVTLASCGDRRTHVPPARAVSGVHARPPGRRTLSGGSFNFWIARFLVPFDLARTVVEQRVEWLASPIA